MNLSGKTILITRAAHQAEGFAKKIRNVGGTTIFFPTIETVPPESWDDCDQALSKLQNYDALVFTSTNGVDFFFRRVNELRASLHTIKEKQVYAVGRETKSAIEIHGMRATATPSSFTAEHLAAIFTKTDVGGKKILFPRGNLGRDVLIERLQSLGATVDSITVYQTKSVEPENIEHVRKLLELGNIDVITFTSPSTVENFVALFSIDNIRQFHATCKFAVIGPVTQTALLDCGITADIVANQSTIQDLVESIVQYFQSAIPA